MPLSPIPPDPKPTAAELAAAIAQHREKFVETSSLPILARFQWERERKLESPDDFLVPFASGIVVRDPGFKYDEYLRSDQWYEIRWRVLAAARHKCAACFDTATQVHHRDYRPRVLRGEDDSPLVPLCKKHHDMIHAGKPSPSWQEIERRLAEIVSQKDSVVAERRKAKRAHNAMVRANPDAFPDFNRRNRERQAEYRRIKKLGDGDAAKGRAIEAEQRRLEMSPYDLGVEAASSRRAALRTYNVRSPDTCPFEKGTPEEAEYDRGWNDRMQKPDW